MTPGPFRIPDLPPGRTIALPSRGETFVRVADPESPGTPVLLLHGWMATGDLNWATVLPSLRGRGPVATMDIRGHGRGILGPVDDLLAAAADDADALAEQLGWSQVVLGGYSMGVAIALLTAHRHPRRVSGVALAGGALHWTGIGRKLLIRRAGWDGTFQRVTAGRGVGRALARRSDAELAELRPWIAAELERGHPGELRRAGQSLARFDARPWISSVRAAASVVVTSQDHLVRPKRQVAMAEAMGAPYRTVDADHDAPMRNAADFAKAFAAAVEDVRRADVAAPEAAARL